MKKRLLAAVLCLAMLISCVPSFAFQAQASELPVITCSGSAQSAVSFPRNERITLTAEGGAWYQWQIKVNDSLWVNISGETGETLDVSYAMIANLCQGDTAYLRVVADGERNSDPVAVTAGEAKIKPCEESAAAPVILTAPQVVVSNPSTGSSAADSANTEAVAQAQAALTAAEAAANAAAEIAIVAEEDAAAKQAAYYEAQDKANAAKAAMDASAVTTEIPAETSAEDLDENGNPVVVKPAETVVTYDPDLQAAYAAAQADADAAWQVYSEAAIALTDAEANLEAAQAAVETAAAELEAAQSSQTELTQGDSTYDVEPTPDTYSVLINYIFSDGKTAAQSYSAKLAAGSSYVATIKHPTVQGYLPYVDGARSDQIDLNTSNIKADVTYTVTYLPDNVGFTVEHYWQNAENDQYTLHETETKEGFTDNYVGTGLEKKYDGFYSLLYNTEEKIAADGSTLIKIYYDRYYYLMTFNLDGGYGVDPIYARYGASIGNVGTPTKAGYSFTGWDGKIPENMPVDGGTFTAQWQAGGAGLTVVFWYENANDTEYSVAGSIQVTDKTSGDTVQSEDYKDAAFENRDNEHFTYNADKAEIKTVSGDGATVLNVYFTRNTYTITFPDCSSTFTCTQEEHEHTYDGSYWKGRTYYYGGCYPAGSSSWIGGTGGATSGHEICGKQEHTHNNSCYSYSDYTVTAKYDSDISKVWETDPIKSLLNAGYVFESSLTGDNYSFLEKMPGQNITMTKKSWSGSTYTWYYYLEVPEGMSAPEGADTELGDDGKTYYLYHTSSVNYSSYNGSLYLTYDEDYFPITGYTQRDAKGENGWTLKDDGTYSHQFNQDRTYKLYYTRNQYELKFMNYGVPVEEPGKMYYYQQDISGTYFEPEYPGTLEKDANVFDGWYDNPFFNESGRFDFEGATMPAGPVILYAHWVPVTHDVNVYSTSAMTEDQKIGDTQVVAHRSTAVEPEEPTHPSSNKYEFVGWFYMSDDTTPVEKAFDFSMPITRDMNIYAKWSSNVMVDYTIYYQLADGTPIADPTKGRNLAGITKTFEAKYGDELYANYRSGYFPETSSHNLEMNIEGSNEYIFVYVAKEEVAYTVKYLEKDTNVVLKEEKHAVTRDAVITERFEYIPGYAPDAYQKRLILSANEAENVIIFWYVKDELHAPVQKIHWIQNITGDGYTEYQSSTELNGVIGKEYTEAELTISGFKYNSEKSNPRGTLTGAGLVLNLYYDRIEYPYEFKFLEQGTEETLADSVTGTARFQAQVTQSAVTIPGYKLVSAGSQAINIQIEDPDNVASKNVKIFYYQEETVTINYQVVGPADCGYVSRESETLKVLTGAAQGSTAAANTNYRFVGWYSDATCTEEKKLSTDAKYTPTKADGTAWVDGTTYYAKFEYDLTTLTITKSGAADANDGFIFDVVGSDGTSFTVSVKGEGSVTIAGVKVGTTYTITERASWSWRYAAAPGEITLDADSTKNEVTITNSVKNQYLLDGSAYARNNSVLSNTAK